MGVLVEKEYKLRKSKGGERDPKARLSSRQKHASRSAFNHKVKTGGKAPAYNWTPSKEVTVKFTGSGKTAKGIKNGIDYITRDGELESYCYDGKGTGELGLGDEFNHRSTDRLSEDNDYNKKYRGENIDHVKNMVFSPPPNANVSREDALKATTEFLKEKYPNHAFVAVYHDDKEKHPHVHVNFKLRDEETGKRLRLTKAETRKFRHEYCRKLEGMGYDVTATDRNSPERKREIDRLQKENRPRLRNTYKVVAFGETGYQNKTNGKITPFIKYETLNGGKQVTIWGKDLKNHFEREKLREGSLVKIKKLEPTLVKSPMFNEDGSISGYKETKRNNWQIENMGLNKERTLETPKVNTLECDDKGIKNQLERKHEHQQNIGFALENGVVKNSPEHKRVKKEQERSWKGLGF